MCYSILFSHLPQKKDCSFVLKSLNPEGLLGSHLCDVTLPALLIRCQFLFCGTKKINRSFYWVIKNLNFLLFLPSIFLVHVFFCSFLIPFTENLITFIKSIFNILLLLIVILRHAFSRLLYLSAQFSCSCIMIQIFYLFCLFQVIYRRDLK